MFQARRNDSLMRSGFTMLALIYHSTVRAIRRSHRNAFVGLLMSMVQSVVMILAFYLMFAILGIRTAPIRGDYLLFIMSGIFMFMIHTRTLSAVAMAEGPASSMMQHAPLNTMVSIASAALSALYLQMLSLLTILFVYHVAITPLEIANPAGAMGMVLLSWFSGLAIGILFFAIKPWAPEVAKVGTSVWSRANMIASGKMFVANTVPSSVLVFFSWNPLFHIIDQTRGFLFLNYSPHHSSWPYALWVSLGLAIIGLMGESYTRRRASASWGAAR